jgi:hypothetical protein
MRIRHIVACGLPQSTILLPHYLINGTNFESKFIEYKVHVSLFSTIFPERLYQFLSKIWVLRVLFCPFFKPVSCLNLSFDLMHKSISRWIHQNKNCGGLLEIWEQLEEIISSDVFVVKLQINFVTFWLNSLTKFCVKVCVLLQRKFFFFLLSE